MKKWSITVGVCLGLIDNGLRSRVGHAVLGVLDGVYH